MHDVFLTNNRARWRKTNANRGIDQSEVDSKKGSLNKARENTRLPSHSWLAVRSWLAEKAVSVLQLVRACQTSLNPAVSGESLLDYNQSERSFPKSLKNCSGYHCRLSFITTSEFFTDWHFEREAGRSSREAKTNWGGKMIPQMLFLDHLVKLMCYFD